MRYISIKLLDDNLKNTAIASIDRYIYFIDRDGIVRKETDRVLAGKLLAGEVDELDNVDIRSYGASVNTRNAFPWVGDTSDEFGQIRALNNMLARRLVGRPITDIYELYKEVSHGREHGDEIRVADFGFVTDVKKPTYRCSKKNTFDYIVVDVTLTSDATKDMVVSNQKAITTMVLDKIENDKKFQRFGIPMNFIELGKLTITRDKVLEYVFQLKLA